MFEVHHLGVLFIYFVLSTSVADETQSRNAAKCVLPTLPAHGSYVVAGIPNAVPGQAFDSVSLNITCNSGYYINGDVDIFCFDGIWSGDVTDCVITNKSCVLPPHPAHGRYTVVGKPNAVPGEADNTLTLNVTCDPGYYIDDDVEYFCYNGIWSGSITKCKPLCRLDKTPSVEHRCHRPSPTGVQWSRECENEERSGVIVEPKCKKDYFFPSQLSPMKCVGGKWNYIARCIPVTSGACILPPFPAKGSYLVGGVPDVVPGQAYTAVTLTITCQYGYYIAGKKDRTCFNGIWSGGMPDCVSRNALCVLPPYPKNGSYVVIDVENAVPDQIFESVALRVTCNAGYINYPKNDVVCLKGNWSEKDLHCVPERQNMYLTGESESSSEKTSDFCRLEKDPSVNYRCLLSPASRATRECNITEPIGTIVRPECKVPNYYFPGVLNHMRCFNGKWNYIARCVPECGLVTPKGKELVIGGRPAERGELPWHAGIYRKKMEEISQICGGSIITQKVVISAGHCFMASGVYRQPASMFAVSVGKIYRSWNDDRDQEFQKSDLSELVMPSRFQGSLTNFQEDISLLFLKETIVYQPHVRPICLDFTAELELNQLNPGKLGKVAGWGLTTEDEKTSSSDYLKVVELPYVSIKECQDDAPLSFREYITGDKFCAGFRNGTAVCKGDSGGGLVFPRVEEGRIRYYLRGLVSTAPNNHTLCNSLWLTTFTQITRHERFIKDYVEL